jgi:hypothetical protein
MALKERKIQHLPTRAYQPAGLKVNVWYGKSMARRSAPGHLANVVVPVYSTTSATTSLLAGSISTTRSFTTMYL